MIEMLQRKAAVQKAFSNIGKKNGSSPPESTSNVFSTAYELFVSKELKSMAERRYDVAKLQAKNEGVIDENKVQPGTEVNTHDNEWFSVSLKQSAASSTLDKAALSNNLMRQGWTQAQVDKLIEDSSKPRKGAVNINISLKG